MNSALFLNIARFILLLAAQFLVLNNINVAGFFNPFPYILFIILYPVNGNKAGLMAASFLLGIVMDLFMNSGGVHAAACVTLAYLRPIFFRFSFGLSYEYQTVKLNDKLSPERFSFILISVITHHFILFILESFQFSFFLSLLFKTLLNTVFTVILCILIIYLFKPKKR
jgi:rod shape-determining protein MreD